MGIDYYNCKRCGEIFPDVTDYATCESCRSKYCEECKEEMTDNKELQITHDDEYEEDEITECPSCRFEIISNDELLKFALEELGISKDEAIKKYRDSKTGGNK